MRKTQKKSVTKMKNNTFRRLFMLLSFLIGTVFCLLSLVHCEDDKPIGRLRGVNAHAGLTEKDIKYLSEEWNVNLVRLALNRNIKIQDRPNFNPTDMVSYDQWLDGELKKLEEIVPVCEKYGIKVLIALLSAPGSELSQAGRQCARGRFFAERKYQKRFLEIWEGLANKYKDSKAIWGYDLLNEPIPPRQKMEGLAGSEYNVKEADRGGESDEPAIDWTTLQEQTVKMVRSIDPHHAIIVEVDQSFNPANFNNFRPIDDPNIVYSCHMYSPTEVTMPSRSADPGATTAVYPGIIKNKMWDKRELEKVLQPAIDFQKKYDARIYIGEFSCNRWAPENTAYRWLKDCVEIFEKHNFDWTYHAFRESDGWSVEHDEIKKNRAPAPKRTEREKLLRKYFAENKLFR